jgi:hypothetical protein
MYEVNNKWHRRRLLGKSMKTDKSTIFKTRWRERTSVNQNCM